MRRGMILWLISLWSVNAASWNCAGVALAQDSGLLARLRKPPQGWTVTKTVPAFNREIGGQVVRITNTYLAADNQSLQVNALMCRSDGEAVKVQEALVRGQGGVQARCPREGKLVFELIGGIKTIERAYQELGFKPQRVTYDVSFRAAPVAKCDDMARNRMYNAFLQPQPNEAAIRDLSKSFTFGDEIRVRNHGLGSQSSAFEFGTTAVNSRPESDGELTVHKFTNLTSKYGVPHIGVSAVITSETFAITPSQRKAGSELLDATEFWPSMDAEIIGLARQITGRSTNSGDKVAALLAWFSNKDNFKFDRRIVGSRYGVKTALKQRFGMCWDYSDSFVTLCRAVGVPCRQVHGWLHNVEGHIWAEVLVDGKGWRQVDPQVGGGCDSRYVPFVATETGAMPFVYASAVRVAPRTSESTD